MELFLEINICGAFGDKIHLPLSALLSEIDFLLQEKDIETWGDYEMEIRFKLTIPHQNLKKVYEYVNHFLNDIENSAYKAILNKAKEDFNRAK